MIKRILSRCSWYCVWNPVDSGAFARSMNMSMSANACTWPGRGSDASVGLPVARHHCTRAVLLPFLLLPLLLLLLLLLLLRIFLEASSSFVRLCFFEFSSSSSLLAASTGPFAFRSPAGSSALLNRFLPLVLLPLFFNSSLLLQRSSASTPV